MRRRYATAAGAAASPGAHGSLRSPSRLYPPRLRALAGGAGPPGRAGCRWIAPTGRRRWRRCRAGEGERSAEEPFWKPVPYPDPQTPRQVVEDFLHGYFHLFHRSPPNGEPEELETYRALQRGLARFEVERVENWTPSRCSARGGRRSTSSSASSTSVGARCRAARWRRTATSRSTGALWTAFARCRFPTTSPASSPSATGSRWAYSGSSWWRSPACRLPATRRALPRLPLQRPHLPGGERLVSATPSTRSRTTARASRFATSIGSVPAWLGLWEKDFETPKVSVGFAFAQARRVASRAARTGTGGRSEEGADAEAPEVAIRGGYGDVLGPAGRQPDGGRSACSPPAALSRLRPRSHRRARCR